MKEELIKVKPCKDWADFQTQAKAVLRKYRNAPRKLFRGVGKSSYRLETTLERSSSDTFLVEGYLEKALSCKGKIELFRGQSFQLPSLEDIIKKEIIRKRPPRLPPCCSNYLVFLRHFGFASPLLDWTASYQIASFFAFSNADEEEDVAIFCYIDRPRGTGGLLSFCPCITVIPRNSLTPPRHSKQKAWYTICTQGSGNFKFCNHEQVMKGEEGRQDILLKFILPGGLKQEVLKNLNALGINDYTLFGSEDSLVRMLSRKTFEW